MSKKNVKSVNEVDGCSVAQEILSESKSNSDKIYDAVSALKEYQKSLEKTKSITLSLKRRKGFISCGYSVENVSVSPSVGYPLSKTDQVHALSVSQQIRGGSAELLDDLDNNSFDFPDGVDDGSDAHNIFELSNRVDAWISEQNLSDDLRASFRAQVFQREADKALNESIKQAQQQQQQQQQQK